jgi:methyltransferase (TIGR00027 family)
MSHAAAKTGAGPMVTIAVEQHFPEDQRIIEDNLAYAILPLPLRAFVSLMQPTFARDWMIRATEKSLPGIWGGMMYRKRYIDDKLSESASQSTAVVNLGAGFDTRAYRLPALADMPVWEVDQPENIEPKRLRLRKLFGAVPANVRLVPIDFDREELGTVLASHGYSTDKRTFFVMEAVTQYLSEKGVKATFDFLARAAPGCRLAFTYVRKDFIEGKALYGQKPAYDKWVVKEQTWLYGMDPDAVPGFLGAYGWKVIDHLGYDELAERYVKPTNRKLVSTPIERMVYAEKL